MVDCLVDHQRVAVNVVAALIFAIHQYPVADRGQRGVLHPAPQKAVDHRVAVARPRIRRAAALGQPAQGEGGGAEHRPGLGLVATRQPVGERHLAPIVRHADQIADHHIKQVQDMGPLLNPGRGRPAIAMLAAALQIAAADCGQLSAMAHADLIGGEVVGTVPAREPMVMVLHRALGPGHRGASRKWFSGDEGQALGRAGRQEADPHPAFARAGLDRNRELACRGAEGGRAAIHQDRVDAQALLVEFDQVAPAPVVGPDQVMLDFARNFLKRQVDGHVQLDMANLEGARADPARGGARFSKRAGFGHGGLTGGQEMGGGPRSATGATRPG